MPLLPTQGSLYQTQATLPLPLTANQTAASFVPYVEYGTGSTAITAAFTVDFSAMTTAVSQTIPVWEQLTARFQAATAATYGLNSTLTGGEWQAWAGGTHYTSWGQPRQMTAEEIAQRVRETARQNRERARAVKRGRKLLLRLLTDAQQIEYARTKSITVVAADGRVFRLRKSRTAELLGPDGMPVAAYCVHPSGGFIAEDTLIAQKLMLETDPASFERIANVTRLRPGAPQRRIVQPGDFAIAA